MGRWSSSPLARPSRNTHFHQSSSQCSVYNLRLALLLFDASGCAAMVARAATSAPSSAKGQNARSAATTELAFMRNRSPPAADRFRLLLNVEKHVLPSSSLTACSLGLTRAAHLVPHVEKHVLPSSNLTACGVGLTRGTSFLNVEKHVLPSSGRLIACSLGLTRGASFALGKSMCCPAGSKVLLAALGSSGGASSGSFGSVLSCTPRLGTAGLGLGFLWAGVFY